MKSRPMGKKTMAENIFGSLRRMVRPAPSFTEVRREVFLLGGRHGGDVLKGALQELETAEPGSARESLLRAVVMKTRTA
jgi:hypothetical protein